jgi:hypothetical protein
MSGHPPGGERPAAGQGDARGSGAAQPFGFGHFTNSAPFQNIGNNSNNGTTIIITSVRGGRSRASSKPCMPRPALHAALRPTNSKRPLPVSKRRPLPIALPCRAPRAATMWRGRRWRAPA